MIVSSPIIQSNICVNAHPKGCALAVRRQIDFIRSRPPLPRPPKLALIVGCSTGYGLASRITAAFGGGAATVGVSFERPGTHKRTGSPGWYNNLAFDRAAADQGLGRVTLLGDAFSDAVKAQTAEAVRSLGRPVDLLIYSLASPLRVDPVDGREYRSVIKPIDAPFTGSTLNVMSGRIHRVSIQPATPEEITATVKVMGGEDWRRWVDFLAGEKLLAEGFRTLAYSYIGPTQTHPIYRHGTLGRAKEHLEQSAREMRDLLAPLRGDARVAVCKALVTRASSVIPMVPLYIACLYKVMKEMGLHEACIEQMQRMFHDRLGAPAGALPLDDKGRIRMDDWELRPDVQERTYRLMFLARTWPIEVVSDIEGYRKEFLEIHGFGLEGVDYAADLDPTTL